MASWRRTPRLRPLAALAAAAWLALPARAAPLPPAEAGSDRTPAAVAQGGPAPAALDEEAAKEAKARAYFTDTPLVDQDGREVRFYSDVLQGRTVCLAFLFTSCREACPLIMAKLARVRRELDAASPSPVRLVVITVDPETDTPEAFQGFARAHGATGPGWTFLGGAKANVAAVLRKLGEWRDDPADHTTAFIAGNSRSRHWTRVRPDAGPQAVAEILRGLDAERPPATASAPRSAE